MAVKTAFACAAQTQRVADWLERGAWHRRTLGTKAMDAAGLARAMRIDIGTLAGALHAEHADAGCRGVLHLSIGTQSDQPQCHPHPHQRAAKHV
ncbi:hypothetical protein VDG09_15065 [Xanthomonas campestris pv. raphani]|uniref:hypothetical protein n=1 Tax=Xanthomonas campestris TaxID=339 RepID=UPI002B22D9D5|nr:hypothetical protein [Xanthomonas campestris]MEA9828962.1 hypothetical protein [Xanthomonas campestris pv. raphani]